MSSVGPVKQLVISREGVETRVAVLEDGRPTELYVERTGQASLVGNIYKGRVENVLAGMDAAFVDIGLERNGFLHVDEVTRPGGRSDHPRKITELLRSGKEIMVQVTRDAVGSKGPRLTTELGIAGRYVVYLPLSGALGVSRRLDPAERERLRIACGDLDTGPGGMIVRTAAEGADAQSIDRDLRFLQRLWSGAERRAASTNAPALVYEEADLALRAVRDVLGPDFSSVLVDDPRLHRELAGYLHSVAPGLASTVELNEGASSLFTRLGLDEELRTALKRRVQLPSGGYLVIDHTEAMTVVDVNTGSYVGRRYLEETTLKTNVEASREIVRQLRLRDIGGIIVIDFIDMTVRSNREAVLATLEAELAGDRTKTYVVEVSPLGLVEMTRQNTARGLREVLTTQCPCCRGEGRVISEDTALITVEQRVRRLAASAALPRLRLEVHPRIAARLLAGSAPRIRSIEAETGRTVTLEVSDASVAMDHVAVLAD